MTESTATDSRARPVVALGSRQVRALLAPLLRGADGVRAISLVGGGLVNTIYRIDLASGARLALRVYAAGSDARDRECIALRLAAGSLPVPEIVFAGDEGAEFLRPYVVYRWIDGITLNECRRRVGESALLDLAEPMGEVLARVAALPFGDIRLPARAAQEALCEAAARLVAGRARERLGGSLADTLSSRLADGAHGFADADRVRGLAHGDLGGRNIIVAPSADGRWRIVGLLDWEGAFAGSPLWDLGSLFRYGRRYSADFRKRFEHGYRAAGGAAPEGWYHSARLLDATRLVGILDEDRDLPGVFAECVELIELLVHCDDATMRAKEETR